MIAIFRVQEPGPPCLWPDCPFLGVDRKVLLDPVDVVPQSFGQLLIADEEKEILWVVQRNVDVCLAFQYERDVIRAFSFLKFAVAAWWYFVVVESPLCHGCYWNRPFMLARHWQSRFYSHETIVIFFFVGGFATENGTKR